MKCRALKLTLSLVLSLCLILQACSLSGPASDNKEFTEFTDTLFRKSTSSDALSLGYTLANPEAYGVSKDAGGLTPISYEMLKASIPESENLLSTLKKFDKKDLSTQQKVLYDSLKYNLEMDLKGSDFLLFSRPLSPVTGIQAQLPVLLAEYSFDSVNDINNYFALLSSLPEYFNSLMSFYEIQSRQEMLPCRDTLDAIINQCLTFVRNNGSRVLTDSFSARMKSCTFIDKAAKRVYKKKNRQLVKKCVLPAYEELINGLNYLYPMSGTDGSLSSYKNGKQYYQYLFASETGSRTDVETYYDTLADRLNASKKTLIAYAKKDPSLFSGLTNRTSANKKPKDQLAELAKSIDADFPKASNVNYKVSYVDKSLEDFLSPAFYLTPPLDAYKENAIYINNSSRFTGADLSTTLAHEGYPGHLYQNVYFRQQNRPLLSYTLNFSGYTEGWATYAETYSYKYLGYSKDEIGILRNNMIVSLCIYGLCDIGIHYYGWDEDKVLSFLNEHGKYEKEAAQSLYTNIIDEPGSYLKYTIGFMEFLKLKNATKKYMGENYSEKTFHEFVLSIGPAPFEVFYDYMGEYAKELKG